MARPLLEERKVERLYHSLISNYGVINTGASKRYTSRIILQFTFHMSKSFYRVRISYFILYYAINTDKI